MTVDDITWDELTISNTQALNNSINDLHHASQFIAMAGKYMVPQEDDDSNTNMGWDKDASSIYGHTIEAETNFQVALQATSLQLMLRKPEGDILATFPLVGSTKDTAFNWLHSTVKELGADISELKSDLHYIMPSHETDNGVPFTIRDKSHLLEIARYRTNADAFFNAFIATYKDASPVRIWPHHFDTGSYIPLDFDEEGEVIRSAGMGLAIADDVCEELYFYVNYWEKNNSISVDAFPDLPNGYWYDKTWTGALLPVSQIVSSESHMATLNSFFETALDSLIT